METQNCNTTNDLLDIKKDSFHPDDIETFCTGAGIVPYSTDEQGRTFLLLGRERFVPSWRGSCRFSGFEGSRKDGETVLDTAVREFDEESLGVCASKDEVRKIIVEKRYAAKIVLKIRNDRYPGNNQVDVERYHCTYLIWIPWQQCLPDTFRMERSKVENVERIQEEWSVCSLPIMDGMHIQSVEEGEDGEVTISAGHANSTCPSEVWRDDGSTSLYYARLDGRNAKTALAWISLRERLERALKCVHHCVDISRDPPYANQEGFVNHVTIHKDYMEKDQIRFWSLDDLWSVLKNRGVYGTDRFRPYFLPVLQAVLSLLNDEKEISLKVDGQTDEQCESCL